MDQQRLHRVIYEEMGIASEIVAPFLQSLYAQPSVELEQPIEDIFSDKESVSNVPLQVSASKAFNEKSVGVDDQIESEKIINSAHANPSEKLISTPVKGQSVEENLEPFIEVHAQTGELSVSRVLEESSFYIEGSRSSRVGILMNDVFSYAPKTAFPIKEDILFENVKKQMQTYIPDLCFIHYQGKKTSIAQYQFALERALKEYAIDYLMVLGQSFYSLVDTRTIPEELRGSVYHLKINHRLFHLVYSYQMSSLLDSGIKKQGLWNDFIFLLGQV